MSHAPHLCIAGGGTGGHLYPALALADAARGRWPELTVDFVGAERGLEAKVLPRRGEEIFLVRMHAVQGVSRARRLHVLLWELPRAVCRIRTHWRRRRRPTLLVGVGGYASTAGVVAALLERVPVVLYEQNAVPGLVNRRLARFCRRVMLGFEHARRFLPEEKTVVTGNIVRPELEAVRWRSHTPPRLLVLGGSLGARYLNETLPDACALLAAKDRRFAVTHVTGRGSDRVARVRDRYETAGIEAEVIEYCDDMARFYDGGDLLIARAGAMTVGETAFCGTPAIFVPLPHAADRHQLFNAGSLADRGAAVVADQGRTTAAVMAREIERLLFDPEQLERMSAAAAEAAVRDAAERQLAVLGEFLDAGDGS